MPIAANAGGLMVMCGSVAILAMGLPLVRAFLLVALAGLLVAAMRRSRTA